MRRELLEVKETSEERIRELNNRVAYVKNEAAARFPATMKLAVHHQLAGEYKLVWIRTDSSYVMDTEPKEGRWYVQGIKDFGSNEMIYLWAPPCSNPCDCEWELV